MELSFSSFFPSRGIFFIISPFPIGKLISRKFLSPWCRRSVERRRELSEIRNSNIFSHIEYMRGEGACVQEFLKVSPPRGQTGYDDGKLASIIVCSQFQKKRAHMPLFRILYNMFMHLIKAQKSEGRKLFYIIFCAGNRNPASCRNPFFLSKHPSLFGRSSAVEVP